MRFKEFYEDVKKGNFTGGGPKDPAIEIPKGYDRFEVDHKEGTNFASVIGIKGNKRFTLSTGHVKLIRELVKAYNSGGENPSGMKPITGVQAFGSEEMNVLHDAGVKLVEKPYGWDEFKEDGAHKKNVYDPFTLRRAEKALGFKLKVYTGKEIFGTAGRPSGMLADAKFPPEEMFIVDFGGGDRWLCDTSGASSYIRNWAKLEG
jgi:hypothetical protein